MPVYTEIHDVCTDLQLESILFQIPPSDAQKYYCARNTNCDYCLPMLETVAPAVKALYGLLVADASSCAEAEDEEGCKEILCPIIADAGCCLKTLAPFYDSDETAVDGDFQSKLVVTYCIDVTEFNNEDMECPAVSSESLTCAESPPDVSPPPPSPPPPPPPPAGAVDITLRVLVVDNDGEFDIMIRSDVVVGGFQFNVVKAGDKSQLVEVSDGFGGKVEEAGFTLSFNFGFVLGFALTGNFIYDQPSESLFVTLKTSPLLQGIPLCLADALFSDPDAAKLDSPWIICEQPLKPCVLDTEAPEAADILPACKAQEHKAAISAISQGGFENELAYDESIGELCYDGCFNPLYSLALMQCDDISIKVSADTAHQLFCAQNAKCQWCMPFLTEALEAAQAVVTLSVKQTCDVNTDLNYDECMKLHCDDLSASQCCVATLKEYISDIDNAGSETLSSAITTCGLDLGECKVVDDSSIKCDLPVPSGPDPSDNSCMAAWVDSDSLAENFKYEFIGSQPFLTLEVESDSEQTDLSVNKVFTLDDWPSIKNCTKSSGKCPDFQSCFDFQEEQAVDCDNGCVSFADIPSDDLDPTGPDEPSPTDDDSGLSTAAMVGIASVAIIGAIVVLGCCFCYCKSRKVRKGSSEEKAGLRNQGETLSQKAFATPAASASRSPSSARTRSVSTNGNGSNSTKYSARMAAARNASRTTSARSGRYSSRTIQLKEMNASMRSITGEDAL